MKPSPVTSALFVCLTFAFSATAAVRYVNLNSANPTPPYTTWTTAAAVIQDAVDVAAPGDEVVVTNGIYQGGTRVHSRWPYVGPNRVSVTMRLSIRSVNGPKVTVIDGGGSMRCVFLASEASLTGFTITNGNVISDPFGDWLSLSGGGVFNGGTVSNCVITGNYALYGGGVYGGRLNNCVLIANRATTEGVAGVAYAEGGGAYDSLLNNCLVVSNTSTYFGGGVARYSKLNNCTVVGNSALHGGGVYGGEVYDSIVYYNTATPSEHNYDFDPLGAPLSMAYTCTTPLGGCHAMYPNEVPRDCGIGNFTNAPLFLNAAGGDFRLQANSPCINAGRNLRALAGSDLDDNPRVVVGTVDIGAYEFQSPQSALSYAWLQQYGLPTDGSADFADLDGDGHNNRQEWRAWTDPTNSVSALQLLTPVVSVNGLIVRWQSVRGQTYSLELGTGLAAHPAFVPFASNIVGQADMTMFTDTNAVGTGPFFYRVATGE